MFGGIVAAVGTVRAAKSARGGRRIVVDAGRLGLKDVAGGGSIAGEGAGPKGVGREEVGRGAGRGKGEVSGGGG